MTDRERLFRDIHSEYEFLDDVIGLPNIHIECKVIQNLDIHKEMDRSIKNAKFDEIPIVASKRINGNWLITMGLNDFLELYTFWIDQ